MTIYTSKNFFSSSKVIESAQIELIKFCQDKFFYLPDDDKFIINIECDRIRKKLKERNRKDNTTREEIRYAVICAMYYAAFGESPLMTAVKARGEG